MPEAITEIDSEVSVTMITVGMAGTSALQVRAAV